MLLDLDSLDSVRDFASKLHSTVDKVKLTPNMKIFVLPILVFVNFLYLTLLL